MVVPYTSYEAKAIEAAITMVANSSTFQTLTGKGSAALAKGRIIEVTGGNQMDADNLTEGANPKAVATNNETFDGKTAVFAQVYAPTFSVDTTGAFRDEDRDGEVEVHLVLPNTADDSPPERYRRWINAMGGLRQDLQDAFGTLAGGFAIGDAELDPMPQNDLNTGFFKNHLIGKITLRWRIS